MEYDSGISKLYDRLNHQRKQIRLVQLDRSSLAASDEPVKCRLSTFDLDDKPTYRALSYVWGDAIQTLPIVVNGIKVQKTTNLVAALRRLVSEPDVDYLWIDALCIDQADVNEKNHQIPLMGSIFADAELVIAWLGEGDEDSDTAVEAMLVWAAAIRKTITSLFVPWGICVSSTSEGKVCDFTSDRESTAHPEGVSKLLRHIDEPFKRETWSSISELLLRSYWRRVWIIQEIALAKDIWFVCGSASIRKWEFFAALSLWEKMWYGYASAFMGSCADDYLDVFRPAMSYILSALQPVLSMWGHGRPGDAREVLVTTKIATATDPRDKIYGVLSLVTDEVWKIVPDYDCSVATVYTNFVLSEIRRTRNLGVICLLTGKLGERVTPDLPTWVPDFQTFCCPSYSQNDRYTWHTEPCEWRVSSDARELRVRGLRCDNIMHVDRATEEERISGGAAVWQVIKRWMSLAKHLTPDPGPAGVSTLSAFFRAMIGDTSNSDSQERSIVQFDWKLEAQLRCTISALYDLLEDLNGWGWPFPERKDAFYEHFPGLRESKFPLLYKSDQSSSAFAHLCETMKTHCEEKTFFVTDEGYVGIAVDEVRPGDLICDLTGMAAPVILRSNGPHFTLLGDCYVYGMMNGRKTQEAMGPVEMDETKIVEYPDFEEFCIR